MKRTVITGIGAVTPLGNTFRESWDFLKGGGSGLGPISSFDASPLLWRMAGQIRGLDPSRYLDKRERARLDLFAQYSAAASFMAAADAGLIDSAFREDVRKVFCSPDYLCSGGVIIGSSRGGISTLERTIAPHDTAHSQLTDQQNPPLRISAYLMPATTTGMGPSFVAQKLGIKGYCLGISNACASGANAIGEAFRLIREGFEGPVLAGGADAPICRICVEGYGHAGALSRTIGPEASRPFDRQRDGFVLAEGACVVVVEELDMALERGAHIYCEIAGYSNTTDAFHQTIPDSKGEARAMAAALKAAGINPEELDYINSHATSTPLGDRAEAEAIRMVFGSRAEAIPVSALKSSTGHMLAGSGAFEAACTAMSILEGLIPPSLNLENMDEGCSVNLIRELTPMKLKTAITNSFGFGGVNAVLALRRFPC